MDLRWEKRDNDCWEAYSGRLLVGRVVRQMDKTIGYTVTGVHMKWIAKGYGDVSSMSYGKKAVTRAWQKWLIFAGLGDA